jgi:hypothetical protein
MLAERQKKVVPDRVSGWIAVDPFMCTKQTEY